MVKQARGMCMLLSTVAAIVASMPAAGGCLSGGARADNDSLALRTPVDDLELKVEVFRYLATKHVNAWCDSLVYIGYVGGARAPRRDVEPKVFDEVAHCIRARTSCRVLDQSRARLTEDVVTNRDGLPGKGLVLLMADGPDLKWRSHIKAFVATEVYRSNYPLRLSYVVEDSFATDSATRARLQALAEQGALERNWRVHGSYEPAGDFGARANLLVSASVVVLGLFWLGRRRELSEQHHATWRFHAFLVWWLSWLAWVVCWGLLVSRGDLPGKIAVIVFDNLNTVCLIGMAFAITRGQDFTSESLRRTSSVIIITLMLFCAAIYGLFLRHVEFAFTLHRTWSLCFHFIALVALGWAFRLRFNTTSVLMVTLTYAFLQPLVYAAELDMPLSATFRAILTELRPVTSMVLCFMKLVLAIVVMVVLWGYKVEHDDNVVGHGYAASKPRTETIRGAVARFREGFDNPLAMFATALTCVYVAHLLFLAWRFSQYLSSVGIALGVATSLMAALEGVWSMWRFLTTRTAKASS